MPRSKKSPSGDGDDQGSAPAKTEAKTAAVATQSELKPFTGIYKEFLDDRTPEILLQGSLSSGKTTAALVRLITHLRDDPGLEAFLFRYSDEDCRTKLRPSFEKVCSQMQIFPEWNNVEKCYIFANGSRCSSFGLRSVDTLSRYSKLKGLGVGELVGDEIQELPGDIALELRARLRQPDHPHSLVFICNPPPEGHWITKQWKDESTDAGIAANRALHRKVYSLSLYDNPFLPAETLRELEAAYPPEHAKHSTVILGKRGVNVIGDPIYGELYSTTLHSRPIPFDPAQVLYEAFDFGKTHPCWVVVQKPFSGGLYCLGGILGQEMFLDDFLPIVQQYRAEWFPDVESRRFRTCCTSSQSLNIYKDTQINQLKAAGFRPVWNPHGNDPDVVLALIEKIASYMRKRSATGKESFAVNDNQDRWLRASSEGITYSPFLSRMCMGGYTWSDLEVSVGRNEMRQPRSDQWFEHPARCLEAIELNFGMTQELQQSREALAKKNRMFEPKLVSHQPQGWME